jgi:hypothetical protein
MTFNDLIDLARLCLKRAVATSDPVAAVQLRRMADDYQARADALDETPTPSITAIPKPSPQAAPLLQQQQSQPEGDGEGEVPPTERSKSSRTRVRD